MFYVLGILQLTCLIPEEEEDGKEEEDEGERKVLEKIQDGGSESKMRAIRHKSLIELLAMSLPLIHVFGILYPVFYYLSMDIPILLISVVPTQSRNAWTILICLSLELFVYFVCLAWCMNIVFMVVSFVLTFKDSARLVMGRISR